MAGTRRSSCASRQPVVRACARLLVIRHRYFVADRPGPGPIYRARRPADPMTHRIGRDGWNTPELS